MEKLKVTGIGNGKKPLPRVQHDTKHKAYSIKRREARSTIYKYVDIGFFPKAVKLGSRSVAWVESEVQEWILERIAQRDGEKVVK